MKATAKNLQKMAVEKIKAQANIWLFFLKKNLTQQIQDFEKNLTMFPFGRLRIKMCHIVQHTIHGNETKENFQKRRLRRPPPQTTRERAIFGDRNVRSWKSTRLRACAIRKFLIQKHKCIYLYVFPFTSIYLLIWKATLLSFSSSSITSVLYISDVTFSFESEIHKHQLSTINIPKNEIRKQIIYDFFFHKQAVRYIYTMVCH